MTTVPERSQKDRILAVDDTIDNLILIQTMLEDEPYEVILAESGKDALVQIETNPPDLILLDIMMPGMDGYEVTRRIRQNPHLPFIPILLITAHDQSSAVEGLDAGADDFIRKPVDVDELLARIRSLLRLKHSIDEREEMLRRQDDFVSRLTHDLRTPLVALNRMLDLLREESFGTVTPEMLTAFDSMLRSNDHLLQMANTLLEVYRHEAKQKNLSFVPCDLQELVEDVILELRPLAMEKGLTLQTECWHAEGSEGNRGEEVLADHLELRRVFTNLISNAIKFTDQGGITVRFRSSLHAVPALESYHPDGAITPLNSFQKPEHRWFIVDVQDTGAGIRPSDHANLFERFRTGNHRRSGSGLGLHLARRIIEAHHGEISVQSEPGQGSTFTVCLPAHVHS